MIHIDRKVFSKLRAGRVDRMLNEHYLAQLTAEHQLLASMRRVEECSELAQSIEDFALDNELDVPKLATMHVSRCGALRTVVLPGAEPTSAPVSSHGTPAQHHSRQQAERSQACPARGGSGGWQRSQGRQQAERSQA